MMYGHRIGELRIKPTASLRVGKERAKHSTGVLIATPGDTWLPSLACELRSVLWVAPNSC